MAFNGSGTFNLPGSALQSGDTVSATEHNTLRNDMASGFTNCVTRDGQSPATANLPMGGFKFTGLAAGTANGNSVRYNEFNALYKDLNGTLTATGSSNAYAVTTNTTYASYAAGMAFVFIANHNNTGAVTLNVNTLGAKDIRDSQGNAILSGLIKQYQPVFVEYDATGGYFRALNLRTLEFWHRTIACSDESTALTTGTAKATFRAPFALTLTDVRASLSTAQASGSIFTVDVNESGTTVLSTKLTIDNTEKTSTTAATAAVISDTSIADDAEITIDIDQVGDGTAKGLKVTLYGYRVA